MPGALFGDFYRNQHPRNRRLIGEICAALAPPLDLEVAAPSWVHASLRQVGDAMVIHLVNNATDVPLSTRRVIFEAVPPVGPVEVRLQVDREPTQVALVSAGSGEITFEWNDGELRLVLAELGIPAALVLSGASTLSGAGTKQGSRAELRERFARDGFVAKVPIFSTDEISAYGHRYDALEARMGPGTPMINLHQEEPFVLAMATDPRLLQAVATVLDTDSFVLTDTQFFVKHPPGAAPVSTFVAWHQDATYRGMEPPLSATAWIAIDDVDTENACLRVIAGSHGDGLRPHGTASAEGNVLSRNQEIPPQFIDEERAVDLCLTAGECSFHDGRTIHGSRPNTSTRRRCGLGVVFVPAYVKRKPSDHDVPLNAG